MLELTYGQSAEKIVVTLDELKTLDEPNYLFIFTHVLTKEVVSFIRKPEDDESDYPERYNQYDVDTEVLLLNKPVGEWQYEVYEQESEDNIDPDNTTGLVEQGKMMLNRAADFEFTKYDESVTFKTYNG